MQWYRSYSTGQEARVSISVGPYSHTHTSALPYAGRDERVDVNRLYSAGLQSAYYT